MNMAVTWLGMRGTPLALLLSCLGPSTHLVHADRSHHLTEVRVVGTVLPCAPSLSAPAADVVFLKR